MQNRMEEAFLIACLVAIFTSCVHAAAFITLQADGFPFTVDENILFHGDLNGNNIDVNFWIVDSDGNMEYNIYLGDRNGSFSVTYTPSSEGDYNAYARDLNHEIQAVMPFKVSNIANVTITYDTVSPPFDASDVNRVYVTFTAYDVNGNVLPNEEISVKLIRASDANTLDTNSGTTSSDGNVQLSFDLSSLQPGDYYFSVNDGLAVFPFSIYSFRVFPYLLNPDTNKPQNVFAPSANAVLAVDVTNYSGTQYLSGATVVAKIYNSNNTQVGSTLQLSGSGSYTKLFSVPSTTGEYRIDVNVTYSGNSQILRLDFFVQQYKMEIFAGEFGGREKEKMPAVFPTGSPARLELHFLQLSGSEIAGTTLQHICNNGAENDHNFLLYYKKVTETNWERILDKQDINVVARSNYCELTFVTPNVASPYFIMVKGIDLNIDGNIVTLSAKAMITVQDYIVFLEPVDPNSCDTSASDVASSCGFKFSFSQGELIGLRADIIDLKQQGGVIEIGKVSGAHVFHAGNETVLTAPADVNYRTDLNILVINPSGPNVANLSGGFYIGGFLVDINKDGNTAQQNVTAFGFFTLKVLNVTTQLVDENGNALQTRGPPIYSSDKNVNIKVTVKSSDGTTAIQGAIVSVSRITNFERKANYNASLIDSNTTNSSGEAIIRIDKDKLQLTSGFYEIVLDINAPTINKTDTVMIHFERRNYFVEAYPASKTKCTPEPFVAPDQNIVIFIEARDAFSWNEYKPSSFTISNVKVYYEGSPEKPLATPILVQNGNAYPSICSCQDRNYKCLEVVPLSSQWQTGFYRIAFDVNRKGVMENGYAFAKVLPFYISVAPAHPGTPMEEYAAPGSQWDFNIYSSLDVNITAKLISAKDWRVFASDLNMYIGNKCIAGNAPGCSNTDTDISALTLYTVDVNIPINLPLAREDFDGYVLQIDANSNGTVASVELFIIPKKWQLYLGKETTEMMMLSDSGEPGPYYFNIRESGRRQLLKDNNVEDNCLSLCHQYDINAYCHPDDNGLQYSRVIMPFNENGPTDFTRIVLLDPENELVYVDRDNDCNFSDGDNIPIFVGQLAAGLDMNKIAYSIDPDSLELLIVPNPRNGPVIFTTIGKSKVSYITTKLAADLNYSSAGKMKDPFMGSAEADRNIGIPVIVRNLDDTPASNVTVQIASVMRVDTTGGTPEQLQEGIDYNAVPAVTDANGIAVPKISVNKAGIIVVGFRLSDETVTQHIMPWEGAAMQVNSYTVTLNFALQDLNIQFDVNVCDSNIITINLPQSCFNPCDTNIAVLDEEDFFSINESAKYYEGDVIRGLIGRGSFEHRSLEIVVDSIYYESATSQYVANFKIFYNGSLLDSAVAGSGTYLQNVFTDSNGHYILKTRVFVHSVGVEQDTNKEYIIVSKGKKVNFDNDYQDPSNPIVRERWYFIPLTGDASCPDANFASVPGQKATLLIDDDNYIDISTPDYAEPEKDLTILVAGTPHEDLNELFIGDASAFPICLYGVGKCDSSEHGYNPRAQYDINRDIDNNIVDGNLVIYNLFSYRENFFDPETMGSSPLDRYIVFKIKNFDDEYVTGTATITGTIFNEQTGLPVTTFNGTAINGIGRLKMDGNFYIAPDSFGEGYMIAATVTYNNESSPVYGFMWSTH